jgi:hypothetical protein
VLRQDPKYGKRKTLCCISPATGGEAGQSRKSNDRRMLVAIQRMHRIAGHGSKWIFAEMNA